ncbi:MAG: hypothetical protein NTX05_08435 [Fusobacteria bacterium]|nr:hypothetical protein [Fusobacteriota bacterium]
MKKYIILLLALLICALIFADSGALKKESFSENTTPVSSGSGIVVNSLSTSLPETSTISSGSALLVENSLSGSSSASGSAVSGSGVISNALDNGEMIHIYAIAKQGKINMVSDNFSASGGIALTYKDITLRADNIYKVPGQPIIIASGHVIFEQDENVVGADSVTVNLFTEQATIQNANSYSGKMFFGGKTLQANYPSDATITSAYFTSDYDIKDPTYHFEAQKMTVEPSSKLVAKNVTFYAGKYPILWVPYYATTLQNTDGRNSLFPQFGSSTQYGNYVLWGVDYKTLPYKYLTGYMDFRYTSKLGWLFNVDDALDFSPTSRGEISATDVNIPNANNPARWNFQSKFHDTTPKGQDLSGQFWGNRDWNFFYQNESTNLLLDPNGIPLNQSTYYTINQQNLWKLQVKGTQQIAQDTVVKADISQSVQSIIQQLSQPNQGTPQNNLPNNNNVSLWTKIALTQNTPLYKYYLNIDNEANLNNQVVGIGFTHKNNFETFFDQKIAKIKVSYTSINQDKLEINPLNPTLNQVLDPQLLSNDVSVDFGKYNLGRSLFYYGAQTGAVDSHNIYNKYNADGTYNQWNVIDQHRFVGVTFGNKKIPVGAMGNVDWNSQNDYLNFDNEPLSGASTIVGPAIMSAGTYDNKVTLTTPLYNNLKNSHRFANITVTNIIPTEYRLTTGNVPAELESYNFQNNAYSTLKGAGEKIVFGFGNLVLTNGYQQVNYYPFQQSWLSEKSTNFLTSGQIIDSQLSFNVKRDTQFQLSTLPSQQSDSYTLTFNSNASQMYQYSFSNMQNFNENINQGPLATMVASNDVWDYNYTNGRFALDYKSVNLFGLDQTQPVLGNILTNQLNHYWTVVYDDQGNKEFSKYVKLTYGYGYNYLANNSQATSTVVTLGFIDKSNAYQPQTSGTATGIASVNPTQKSSNSLFDDKQETNNLINSNASVQPPYNLMTVGESYQQNLMQSEVQNQYRSYTFQLSTSRDMAYAYANNFTPQNWLNSYSNYTLSFDMKLQQFFEWNPFVTLTRPLLTGSAAASPSQAELGENITFQLGPTDYGYWLSLMTAYDWAPNPTNTAQRIGWSDLGIGLIKRVRAVDWIFSVEKQWNYNTNQLYNLMTIAVSINAFPGKGIGYSQNGPNRGFSAGL